MTRYTTYGNRRSFNRLKRFQPNVSKVWLTQIVSKGGKDHLKPVDGWWRYETQFFRRFGLTDGKNLLYVKFDRDGRLMEMVRHGNHDVFEILKECGMWCDGYGCTRRDSTREDHMEDVQEEIRESIQKLLRTWNLNVLEVDVDLDKGGIEIMLGE